MSERRRAADDFETIGDLLRNLDQRRRAIFNCACDHVIGPRGEVVRVPTTTCVVHRGEVETDTWEG